MSDSIEKKEYEIGFIARNEKGGEIMQMICTRHGGEIVRADELRKLALAYPIQKETSGFFGMLYALLDPASIKEIENEVKLEQQILRVLVISDPIKMRVERPSSYSRPSDEAPHGQDKQAPAPIPTPSKAVTNEELEKKLEEILG